MEQRVVAGLFAPKRAASGGVEPLNKKTVGCPRRIKRGVKPRFSLAIGFGTRPSRSVTKGVDQIIITPDLLELLCSLLVNLL